MAILFVSKKRANRQTAKKPKFSPKQMDHNDGGGGGGLYVSAITFRRLFLHRIPVAFLLMLMILFIWSSSTTILSGSIVHICVSSRKLSNLYCVSAGSQPNLNGVSFPLINKNNNETATTSITASIISNSNNTNIVEEEKFINVVDRGTNHKEEEVISIPDHLLKTSNSSGNSTSEDGEVREKVEDDDEIVNAVKAVQEQLQVHRSWSLSSNKNNGVQYCDGRGVFVYDLPTKFNKDLVAQCGDMVPWMTNFCEYLTNEAKGQPISKLGKGWYNTHQYSLEPIFHSRVLKHPCRVTNEKEAKLFYVPYYGGLDILRWHFRNVTSDVKDKLGLELMEWLEMQQSWNRNSGKDHVFVLGKISWDFRRYGGKFSWGTRFLKLKEMENPLKLLIERHPWEINEIGVPHPTYFHPQADNDIIEWQMKIIGSNRKNLISFAGAARPGAPENIRSILIKQCTSREDGTCRFFDCSSGGCSKPESVVELFMESEFCLQPPGDSPTRKSVFDSLLSGCIPVLFDPFTAYYQYPWHLPEDHGRYSVFIDQKDVRDFKVDVVEKLMEVSVRERDDMRRYIVYELLPGLVYGDSNSELHNFKDAFSISMDNLLDRVTRLNDSSIA